MKKNENDNWTCLAGFIFGLCLTFGFGFILWTLYTIITVS